MDDLLTPLLWKCCLGELQVKYKQTADFAKNSYNNNYKFRYLTNTLNLFEREKIPTIR